MKSMSFEKAKKTTEFWHAYWENKDERFHFNDKLINPEEFYEVWIDKGKVHTFEDIPERSEDL
tara:strand:+ start:99 stop:287 length:189 start_codon:yes stop_codon:yes gene_type:complete